MIGKQVSQKYSMVGLFYHSLKQEKKSKTVRLSVGYITYIKQ